MTSKDGLPPGWGFRQQNQGTLERERNQSKRNKALNGLQAYFNGTLPGEPVEYDDSDLPIIPDPQDDINNLQVEEEEPMPQQYTSTPQPQRATAKPQQQQQRIEKSSQVPQQYQQQSLPLKAQHPVVLRMLEKFGISKTKKHVLELYPTDNLEDKFSYTMAAVPEELAIWCLNEARDKQITEGELSSVSYFHHLLSCCSVVGIDGTPVWQIFNVTLNDPEIQKMQDDPFRMSTRVRKECARNLAAMLWTDTRPITDKLFEFYDSKINTKVKSSNDLDIDGMYRYVCPLDSCTVLEFFKPENEQQYFCKIHGVNLVQATDITSEADYPLA